MAAARHLLHLLADACELVREETNEIKHFQIPGQQPQQANANDDDSHHHHHLKTKDNDDDVHSPTSSHKEEHRDKLLIAGEKEDTNGERRRRRQAKGGRYTKEGQALKEKFARFKARQKQGLDLIRNMSQRPLLSGAAANAGCSTGFHTHNFRSDNASSSNRPNPFVEAQNTEGHSSDGVWTSKRELDSVWVGVGRYGHPNW